jgi:hypothetical protein
MGRFSGNSLRTNSEVVRSKESSASGELVMSAYLMICLHSDSWNPSVIPVAKTYQTHELWNEAKGWKNWLNNLRLILQPFISFNLVLKWLKLSYSSTFSWVFDADCQNE